jgi:hypothetical protein
MTNTRSRPLSFVSVSRTSGLFSKHLICFTTHREEEEEEEEEGKRISQKRESLDTSATRDKTRRRRRRRRRRRTTTTTRGKQKYLTNSLSSYRGNLPSKKCRPIERARVRLQHTEVDHIKRHFIVVLHLIDDGYFRVERVDDVGRRRRFHLQFPTVSKMDGRRVVPSPRGGMVKVVR